MEEINLSRNDIESFGFEVKSEDDNFINFRVKGGKYSGEINFLKKSGGRCVFDFEPNLFIDITLKNKSEFKKFMKQIRWEIINE